MVAVPPATDAGFVVFGKNSDREFNEAQYLDLLPAAEHPKNSTVRITHTEIPQALRTHAVLLSRPYWIWGAEIGANDSGLTIGNEAIYARIPAATEPGIIGMDLLRLALERASDVDEGIHVITSLLRQHGQSGNCSLSTENAYHNSFILADPKGAKVLETVDREWVVRSITSHYAISNSLTIEGDYAYCSPTSKSRALEAGLYEEGKPFRFRAIYQDMGRALSAHHRRGRAMTILGERCAHLKARDFFDVLRDHIEGAIPPDRPCGPKICAHTPGSLLGHTTASWVGSLASGKTVHWVTGTAAPCTSLYKPVLLETGLPAHGPKPGKGEDHDSLWWRHEKLRRLLSDSGDAVQSAYEAERNALEATFLENMEECPDISDAESRVRAREIVERCWRDALAFERQWLNRSEQAAT